MLIINEINGIGELSLPSRIKELRIRYEGKKPDIVLLKEDSLTRSDLMKGYRSFLHLVKPTADRDYFLAPVVDELRGKVRGNWLNRMMDSKALWVRRSGELGYDLELMKQVCRGEARGMVKGMDKGGANV